MPDMEIAVLKRFLNRDTGARIERQHAIKQIQCIRVRIGEQPGERDLGHEWQIADVLLGTGAANARERLFVWCAEIVQDLVELVDIVTALEERASSE